MTATPLPATQAEADDALERGSEDLAPVSAPEAEPASSPAPATPDRPRDAQGRFTTPEPSPEPSPTEAPTPTPAGEPVAEPEPEEPWSITADGQPFTITGSAVGEDGVFIPAAEVPKLERLVQQGVAWDGSAQRYFDQVNQRQQALSAERDKEKARATAAEAQIGQILGHFEKLIQASRGLPIAESPIGQWLQDVDTNWPLLQEQAKALAERKQYEADRQALEALRQQQQDAQLAPQKDQALSDWILHYGQAAHLERDVLEDVYKHLRSPQFESVVFLRAPQDDPLHGIQQGELVINHGVIQQEVERVARWVSRAAPKAGPTATPSVAPKKVTPPPTVTAAQGPSPKKPLPVPSTKEEADRMLEEGGYDLD